MSFPFFEIQLKTRKLNNNKFKSSCNVYKHTGDAVNTLMTNWEIKGEYETKESAYTHMQLHSIHFLKRNLGVDINKIRITRKTS